jgi:hypothetical protein
MSALPGRAAGESERRLTRRVSIAGALVEVALLGESEAREVVFAVDVNADGIGLDLGTPFPIGSMLLLTFQLAAGVRFSRAEARVVHSRVGRAGVRFVGWDDEERLRLLDYLAHRYETDGKSKS